MQSVYEATLFINCAPSNGQICYWLEKKCRSVIPISPVQSRHSFVSQFNQTVSRHKLMQVHLQNANQSCHGRFLRADSRKTNDILSDVAHGCNQVPQTKLKSELVKGHEKHAGNFDDGINDNDYGTSIRDHSQTDFAGQGRRSQYDMYRSKNEIIQRAVGTSLHSNNDVQQEMEASASVTSADTKGEINGKTYASLEQLTSYSKAEPAVDLSQKVKVTSTSGPRLNQSGLGIVEFLRGKRILITGATGYLAKVLVEKILREQPDVGQLYLLINADSTEKAKKRLVTEVQSSGVFEVIRGKWGKGKRFEEFMEEKVTATAGNIAREGLGLEERVGEELAEKVDVIVNSAATTKFDERYDVAIDLNTKGPVHLLEFGKKCRNLQLFIHISTAFVNGERSGCILEMPFQMNCSIANESHQHRGKKELNIKDEIALVQNMPKSFNIQSTTSQTLNMQKLGSQRANLHGWQDTYVFTKAMGEMLIGHIRGNIPVVIVRPSVVESTLMQPFPGWMEGIRMLDPIAIAYGKGLARAFLVDPKGVLDVIPADMVINATLAAMAKHAKKPSLTIYQIGSSVVNPLTFNKLADQMYEHFKCCPFVDEEGVPIVQPRLRLFKNKMSFRLFSYLYCELPRRMGRYLPWSKKNISKKRRILFNSATQQITHLIEIYTPYTFYKGRFDISNTEILHTDLSAIEKRDFGFEIRSIDWDHYLNNVHFPGLRKYSLKGRNTTTRL